MLNWLEKQRLKALASKYKITTYSYTHDKQHYWGEWKTADQNYLKFCSLPSFGDLILGYTSYKINITKKYPYQVMRFFVDYKFQFEQKTLLDFEVPDWFTVICRNRFRILENKPDAKLHMDKLIWVKKEKRFYPEWVILDPGFTVYNIYDYV